MSTTSDDVVADLESSQLALFESVSQTRRRVLEAKVRVAQAERNADVEGQLATISQEYAAKKAYNSGARLSACWKVAADRERTFTDRLISDCLEVGVSEPVLARYAKAETCHYLRAFASSRAHEINTNPGQATHIMHQYWAEADARAAQVPDLVKSRAHDFEREKGTRLERKLKWLAKRPIVTIVGGLWVIGTAIYGHIEMLQKLKTLILGPFK